MCVEGLNCKFDLRGKTDDFPGIMQRREEPLNVLTDIKLVDPSDEQVPILGVLEEKTQESEIKNNIDILYYKLYLLQY